METSIVNEVCDGVVLHHVLVPLHQVHGVVPANTRWIRNVNSRIGQFCLMDTNTAWPRLGPGADGVTLAASQAPGMCLKARLEKCSVKSW